ncbi:patatin-like phospholipase family protein [Larkinella bovis]|uniref:Patatin-like phospholipase family protein n=1 Tax=Larkinella bovis TaxID=683041 RepID=A0ABW0I5T9_9BACT
MTHTDTKQTIKKSLRLPEILEEEYAYLYHVKPDRKANEQFIATIQLRNTDELMAGIKPWLRPENATTIPTPNELRYKELARWLVAEHPTAGTLEASELTKLIERVLQQKLGGNLVKEEAWMHHEEMPLRPYTRGMLQYYRQKRPFEQKKAEDVQTTSVLRSFLKMAKAPEATRPEEQFLNRLLLEDTFVGYLVRVDDQRLEAIFNQMYSRNQTALCLSGGGIRSATFALGIIQGLVKIDLLDKFTYLSTVSGGGYLGGWLSAWIHHEGFPEVIRKLKDPFNTPLEPEAVPVRHLRQYSNYLSPVLGLFSADSWTLAAIYLRNLLLVWLVIVPLLAAFAGLPWFFLNLIELDMDVYPHSVTFALALSAIFTTIGAFFIHSNRPQARNRPARERAPASKRNQGAFLVKCLLPVILAGFCMALAWHWFERSNQLPAFYQKIRDSLQLNQDSGLRIKSYGTVWIILGTTAVHLAGWLLSLWFRPANVSPDSRGLKKKPPTPFSLPVFMISVFKNPQIIIGLLPLVVWEFLAVILTGMVAGFLLELTALFLQLIDYDWSTYRIALYTCLAVPGFLLSILLAGYFFEGLVSVFTDDAEREWSARYSAWLLITSVGWLAVCSLILFSPILTGVVVESLGASLTAGLGIGSWVLTALLGQSSKTASDGAGTAARKGSNENRSLSRLLPFLTLPVVAIMAVIALFVALSMLDLVLIRTLYSWFDLDHLHLSKLTTARFAAVNPWLTLLVITGLFVLGLLVGGLVNTNDFSLHALYRMRLIRAYLGASRPPGERQSDPFTGFDPTDNIHMGRLLFKNKPIQGPRKQVKQKPPFHIINIALNLVAGRNLAWQERKAESFTVSPLHAGALFLGYRRTYLNDTGGFPYPDDDPRYYGGKRGITLGTALTISGAAASPNQGYHSSPVIGFLMTLFNVRLGWWLGNPGPAGDKTFNKSSPGLAIRPILLEMIGKTDDISEYVYLSDGGHFENLGLYEMVLRRNRVILVSDASCDETCTLEDLGNAIRKVRIDHGITIDFPLGFNIRSRLSESTSPGKYLAIGRIRYSEVTTHRSDAAQPCQNPAPIAENAPFNERANYFSACDGILLYIKPAFYGNEPRDIFNYASAKKAFPHESTSDQFFSESQFESYRALGAHSIENINADLKSDLNLSLQDFFVRNTEGWTKCITALNKKIFALHQKETNYQPAKR